MVSNTDFAPIAALDLDSIKAKLMRPDDGSSWTLERANAVEFEYRRFLHLMKVFPHEHTAPRVDVDKFWHCHILHTKKYAADCEAVFGYFLHHYPQTASRGKEDEAVLERMGECMRVLYEGAFGESYIRTAADDGSGSSSAYCTRVDAQPAYCTRADVGPAYCTRIDVHAAGGGDSGNDRGPATAFSGRYCTDRPPVASV